MNILEDAKLAAQAATQAVVSKLVPLAPDSWIPGGVPDPLIGHKHGLIGTSVSRRDGRLKVQGTARFAAEVPLDGMVYAALAYGTIPRGRIATLDTGAAEGAAGFVTLGPDPNNSFNLLATDGVGNSISVARSTAASFRLVGGGGADTFFISGGATSTLGFLQSAVTVDAGGEANARLVIVDTNRTAATRVTVTATSVGAGTGDNIFSNVPGSRVNYAGFGNGQVVLDLGTQAVGGNQVNVEGTSAGTTFVFGTAGQDTFFVNGTASGNGLGNLNAVFGMLNFEGRSGAGDVLVVSDYGATSGNQVGRLAGNQILGLAGLTDASVINYFNVGSVAVFGSNSAVLAEQFTVASPAVTTSLFANAGPDTVNVQSTAAGVPVGVFGGAGDDLIRVTSTAGSGDFGNLLGINGPLNIDAEAGNNRLLVSNGGSAFPATFTVAANSISGASPQPINYTATGGNFLGAAGDGVTVLGSDAAGDTFNVVSTRAGSQTLILGNGGNDQFNAVTQNLNGVVRLSGGFGSDSFVLDPDDFGSTATPLVVSGGGGGTDRALFLGFAGDDLFPPAVTITGATTGVVTGLGVPVNFDTLTNLDYDGRTGRNNFTFVDGTGVARGSVADPGSGIVVQPKSVAAAEIRLGGGTVGPVVNVTNINGSDAAGLLIDGRGRDTLTVLGASGTGLGGTGGLANTVSDTGTDTITVSEQIVTIRNLDLGDLRTVAVARFDTGIPLVLGALTIPTLIVRAGDESGAGDNVAVTPSSNVNIVVDGGLPGRGRNGDVITSNGGEPTTVSRVNDPATGQQVTRLVTPSNKSAAFSNFENAGGGRQIFAVGADAGGGPRVRVYDAATRAVLFDNFVYEESFSGGVRVATGDVTGDGVPDLVVAAGYGGGPRITVFDGVNFQVVADFFAFEDSFRGGAYVAVGDLTGDGVGDIVVGAGLGGGPVVRVFDGGGRVLTGFFAYDPVFRGGVRVATGDVNGDGLTDIITGAGPGGGPHVRVINASDLQPITEFQALGDDYRGGVYVAAGDVDNDGAADILIGPGANDLAAIALRTSRDGGSLIRINLVDIGQDEVAGPVPAGRDARESGGVRVSFARTNPDSDVGQAVITRGPGFASTARVVGFGVPSTATGIPPAPTTLDSFDLFEPEFQGGAFVG